MQVVTKFSNNYRTYKKLPQTHFSVTTGPFWPVILALESTAVNYNYSRESFFFLNKRTTNSSYTTLWKKCLEAKQEMQQL